MNYVTEKEPIIVWITCVIEYSHKIETALTL